MDQEKILEILKDYKNAPNQELLKLTRHLDSTESSYNKILEEFNRRTKNV
jgi:hypothetical protein